MACTEVSRVAGGMLFLGVCVGGLETSAGVTDEYRGSAAQWWGSPRVLWGLDATKVEQACLYLC